MEIFKDYEKKALNLLTKDILTSEQFNKVLQNSELLEYEYTGSGYFLTVRNPKLPKERLVCSKPIVMGHADGIDCGFVIFIENSELMLECHSWGEINVSDSFRNKQVKVEVVTLEPLNNF